MTKSMNDCINKDHEPIICFACAVAQDEVPKLFFYALDQKAYCANCAMEVMSGKLRSLLHRNTELLTENASLQGEVLKLKKELFEKGV